MAFQNGEPGSRLGSQVGTRGGGLREDIVFFPIVHDSLLEKVRAL